MKFSLTLCIVVGLVALAAASPHVPSHISELLQRGYHTHNRFFPDWKYEGFPSVHHEQDPSVYDRKFPTPLHQGENHTLPPNKHMANQSLPYPANLQWLLSMFAEGYGIPRSYNDILPNGLPYWSTKTYLSIGAFDEYGRPTELDSIIAIQERTLTRFGLNLYDAATWQMALTLWGLYDVAYIYESNILYTGSTGPAGTKNGNPGGIVNIRADATHFKYGAQKVAGSSLKVIPYPGNVTHFPQQKNGDPGDPMKKGPGSAFYRMIGPKYTMVDPMAGAYDNAWKYPWPNYDKTTEWNTFGIIHFNDWKPITGENVWGAILGPIQALGLKTRNNLTATPCGNYFLKPHLACDWKKYETTPPSVQLGISILPALLALQTEQGSLYHCPWGSKIFPPDPEEGDNVSNENNFSGYASLKLLEEVLKNYTKGDGDELLTWALTTTTRLRKGLDKWFDSDDMLSPVGQLPNNQRVIPQGGHINSSGYFPVAINTVGGLAIDCQTWGMTVLGREHMDSKFGFGTSYNIWETAKKYAGYYKGDILCGVGYTDLTNVDKAKPQNDIWSAEWTFGAINMAQTISGQYAAAGDSAKAQSMLQDAQSMYNEVTKPWPSGLQFPDGSYVYANKRFFIPWGWFSNPVSALCSTAWSVFQDLNFDPFHYGGGDKPKLIKPRH